MSRMLVAVGFSPAETKESVSAASEATPLAWSDAPPVVELFSQPRPVKAGWLLQGHASAPL